MGILDKVKDWMGKNPDKASGAIDKAGDFVDRKTQGKYAQHVDKVQNSANKYVNKGNPEQQPPGPGPQQGPPPQQP